MHADRAARQTIEACRRGRSEITLSLPAKVAVTLHGLMPGLTADVLGLVNRCLPGAGGIGAQQQGAGEIWRVIRSHLWMILIRPDDWAS